MLSAQPFLFEVKNWQMTSGGPGLPVGSPRASLFPSTELSPGHAGGEDEDRLAEPGPADSGLSALPLGASSAPGSCSERRPYVLQVLRQVR